MVAQVNPTPQHVPEELFEGIVWCAVYRVKQGYPLAKVDIAELSTLSLVCRYWASICRDWLHRQVTLRSPADLRKFRFLVESTPSSLTPIVQYARIVACTVDARDIPWLHHVQDQVISKSRDPKTCRYEVDFQSPGADDVEANLALRPLHAGLPRSLPRRFSDVDRVTVRGTHFRNGAELCRFIRSIPSERTRQIALIDLTWTTKPDLETFFSLSLGGTVPRVHTRCNSIDEFNPLWLLPALFKYPGRRLPSLIRPEYPLHHDDYKSLLRVVSLATSSQDQPLMVKFVNVPGPSMSIITFLSCDIPHG